MGREHQARGTEGSRTHYLPDRGTHWSKGQLRFWFKNETRPVPTRVPLRRIADFHLTCAAFTSPQQADFQLTLSDFQLT
jgi:hypothetical protein